jgi:hypothetical protein
MTRFIAVAIAVGLAIAPQLVRAAQPTAEQPTYEELQKQLAELQSRVRAIEQQQQQAAGSDEVRKTVEDIVKDAEQRSKFIAVDQTLTAGYDKSFYIRSEDGAFTLRPGLLMQLRNVTNFVDEDDGGIQNGFEFRRVRPRVDGTAFTEDFSYTVVLDVARSGGGVSLLDAFVQYRFEKQWAVKAGQFRNSWFHEGDVSDSVQLAVERSLVDSILGGSQTDRVQGVALIYGGTDKDAFRTEVAYHDGANSKNTNFEDTNANFGTSGRVEYKVFGKWADYKDFSARSTKEQLLVVGAGADWTQFEGADIVRTTIDAQFENATRWALYAALNGNFRNDDDGDFDWGALAQAGYAINQKWEPFVRYDVVVIDDDGTDAYNEFTVGVNYFLGENGAFGHKAKFVFDLMFLPDGAPSDQTGVGVLASDDPEVVLRGGFQLML